MKRQLIRVKQKYIKSVDLGDYDAWSCPVALAIKDQIGCCNVSVAEDGIDSSGIDVHIDMIPPRSVQRFVKRFDNGKKVKPFNFYLEFH